MRNARNLWENLLGRRMSLRMEHFFLRGIPWNQGVYADWLQNYVTETTRWLDAGCGRRLLPPDFRSLERELVEKAGLAIGSDASTDALHRHTVLKLCTCASLEKLPFPDESFDLVTCNMVVEHLPDPHSTFQEFTRVLAPGGVLLIHTPNIWNHAVTLARVLKKLIPAKTLQRMISWSEERQETDIFPTHYRANSRSAITAMNRSSGLTAERFQMLVGPQPVTRFFAPLALCELLWMRTTALKLFRPLATTMLCSFRKPMHLPSAKPTRVQASASDEALLVVQ